MLNLSPEALAQIPADQISKMEMVHNFLMSMQKFAVSGCKQSLPEILAAREATCRSCDQWDATALNATGRCRKCGCSTWAKLRMATERCPLGKWEAVTPAPEVLTGARE